MRWPTAREAGTAVDPALMPAIVRYLQQFPDKLHHPKEERAPVPPPARAHRRAATTSSTSSTASTSSTTRSSRALAQQVEALAAVRAEGRQRAHARARGRAWRTTPPSCGDHLGCEESVILPAAQRHLLPEDWRRSTRLSPRTATRSSAATATRPIASCSRASSTSTAGSRGGPRPPAPRRLQPSRYQLCTDVRSLAQPESDSTRFRFAPATCGR